MRVIPKGREFELRMVRGCVSVKLPSAIRAYFSFTPFRKNHNSYLASGT